ncbi:MAG: endo alpha-1,4 polygalactosaminidase [Acidimicrobiales bacterium]
MAVQCARRVAAAALCLVGACGDGAEHAGWWRPDAVTTWQWQLQGTVNTGYDVDVYDVDLLESSPEVLDGLRAQGRRVVCYFAAGTWDTFSDDLAPPTEAAGRPLADFPDERWLDVRHDSVRALVTDRLELAQERNCDGVEPDNVDGFANDTGFDLTASDQLAFNRFLAAEAHERNLAVGLKNDLDQVADLVDDFDFAINEQCHEYDECEKLTPFIDAGKPVFNAEYDDRLRQDPGPMCEDSRRLGLQTLVLPLELDDSFRISCDDRER